MTGNVIYATPLRCWIEITTFLADRHGLKVCYCVEGPKRKPLIQEKFPEVIIHDQKHALRGIPAESCNHFVLPALDQPLIKELASNELLILQMIDGTGWYNTYTFYEKVELYHTNLRYWLAVLTHYNPSVVLFQDTPHLVYDYIVYILCKKLGIPTISFTPTTIQGVYIPVRRFDNNSETLITRYEEELANEVNPPQDLSVFLKEYIRKVQGNHEQAIPYYMKELVTDPYIAVKKPNDLVQHPPQISTQSVSNNNKKHPVLGWLFRRLFFFEKYPTYLKTIFSPIETGIRRGKLILEPKLLCYDILSEWLYKFRAEIHKRNLKEHYQSLVNLPDLQQNYVFIPLHYQPESTTSPSGDIFVNQLLMVDILSKALPENWFLYVKEHPSQFSRKLTGELGRTVDFYDRLVSFPNVQLVPHMISPFDLIDHSKAVATVTGTAGWEAVLRGKPALTFGFPWYKGCEGVFYTPTVQACKDVFADIEEGYHIQEEQVKRFLLALDYLCVRGYEKTGEQNCLDIIHAIEKLLPF
jgi:hypothetical protein